MESGQLMVVLIVAIVMVAQIIKAGVRNSHRHIAAALAPFELSKHLSANRTQGVPNMIALVKRTAERYATTA